ncbi:MAG: hypothetical protein D4S01_01920 [Dehalococcoidia bacterium]|nr:MAG: hypothetical protein D4S01_01920 [Dehalococcoidia bacterium]
MLVGICGKAGAGKDTVGDYLIDKYGFKKIALADPIKRLVKDVFALDHHTVYDRDAREQPLDQWDGWSVRKLLQYIGTELFRQNIDDAIWVKSLWHRIRDDKDNNYVVTDVRFPNELQFFEENGGDNFLSVKVCREGCEGGVGISGHESEKHDLETRWVINNDGTFEDLYNKVSEIMANNTKVRSL